MSYYGQKHKPDIEIPRDAPHDMENLIRRESASLRALIFRGSYDTIDEQGQLSANIDALLDNYPLGLPRNEITLEQAHRLAGPMAEVVELRPHYEDIVA